MAFMYKYSTRFELRSDFFTMQLSVNLEPSVLAKANPSSQLFLLCGRITVHAAFIAQVKELEPSTVRSLYMLGAQTTTMSPHHHVQPSWLILSPPVCHPFCHSFCHFFYHLSCHSFCHHFITTIVSTCVHSYCLFIAHLCPVAHPSCTVYKPWSCLLKM